MAKSGLPNSIRKYLRQEKSRIRQEILDAAEAQRHIQELMERVSKEYRHKKERSIP